MVCKHFNLDARHIEQELLYERWICYLAVALDLDEIEQFNRWWVAGQDPKKFKWSSLDHAGTRSGDVTDGLMAFASALVGRDPSRMKKRDPYEYAKATGRLVYKMELRDQDTGKFLRYVYVDTEGNVADETTHRVIESQHPDSKKDAAQIMATIALKHNQPN